MLQMVAIRPYLTLLPLVVVQADSFIWRTGVTGVAAAARQDYVAQKELEARDFKALAAVTPPKLS